MCEEGDGVNAPSSCVLRKTFRFRTGCMQRIERLDAALKSPRTLPREHSFGTHPIESYRLNSGELNRGLMSLIYGAIFDEHQITDAAASAVARDNSMFFFSLFFFSIAFKIEPPRRRN